MAPSILCFCFSHGIALEGQWIPRSPSERADLLSRFVDKDDWRVNPSVFRLPEAKWGPHAIDRFASYYNAQLPRFNSKFFSACCPGVDAFVRDWSGESNWVCPPVGFVVNAVRVLTACSGRGTYVMDLHGLSHSSGRFLCFPPYMTSFWKAEVRCISISPTRPFFAFAQNSECWLCVWILGGLLVV